MSLTKDDLLAIRQIVQSEVRHEIQPLKEDVFMLKADVNVLKKDVSMLKKALVKVQKDLKTIINTFDRQYLHLDKRVCKIESRLGIQTPEF